MVLFDSSYRKKNLLDISSFIISIKKFIYLFGLKVIMSTFMIQSPNNIPSRGIENPGSVCYILVILYQLYHCPVFRSSLLSHEFPSSSSNTSKDNKLIEQLIIEQLIIELKSIFNQLSSLDQEDDEEDSIDIFPFFDLLAEISEYKYSDVDEPKDALEFMTYLFSLLAKYNKEFLSCFSGEYLNIIKAIDFDESNSNYNIQRKEKFHYLSLDTTNEQGPMLDLDACFQHYLKQSNSFPFKWKSPDSGEMISHPTIKYNRLESIPDHLIIHLRRFKYDFKTKSKVKLNHHISFPSMLDLSEYTNKPSDEFLLVGVVIHRGTKATSGHYYSVIRPNSQGLSYWSMYNDDHIYKDESFNLEAECFGGISDISDNNIEEDDEDSESEDSVNGKQCKTAMILFYQRISI